MGKLNKILVVTVIAVLSMCSTVFAGTWKDNQTGWYWQEEDGSYPVSSWKWIDGDGDGIAESYYFNEQGYLLTNTTAPDGYQVDQDGHWIVNGVVQRQGQGSDSTSGTQLYQDAQNKTNSLDSIAADAKMVMNMSISGMDISADGDMDFKIKGMQSNNIKFLMNMRMSMLGETAAATAFYADGNFYMDMDGTKMKMAMPLDELMKEAMSNPNNMMQASELLRNIQVSEDGSGNRTLTYDCNAKFFTESFAQISKTMGIAEDINGLQVKQFNGAATINSEGYFTSSTIIVKCEIQIEGQPVTYDISVTVNYDNPGQTIDFELPSTAGYESVGF